MWIHDNTTLRERRPGQALIGTGAFFLLLLHFLPSGEEHDMVEIAQEKSTERVLFENDINDNNIKVSE